MSNANDITNLQELLEVHRNTLVHLLQQAAAYGGIRFAPPATANAIVETRTSIAQYKTALRDNHVMVEDLPFDTEEPLSTSATKLSFGKTRSSGGGANFNFYGTIHSDTSNFGGQQHIERVEATMGDNINISNVSGTIINLKATLNNVTQQIDALPSANQATKDELKQLLDQLNSLLQQTPADKLEDAGKLIKRTEAAVDEVNKPQPDKELVIFNVESLKKAADNIGAVIPHIIPIATKIAGHLLTLAG